MPSRGGAASLPCHFFLFFFLLLRFTPSLFAFDLEGTVKLESPLPEPRLVEVDPKHQAACGEKKQSAQLRVSPEGFVANALLRLEGNFPPLTLETKEALVLDQIDCEFKPHVVLLPPGATLSILNSDGFLHNVRAFDEKTDMLFNDAMPKKGQVLKKRFERPGRYIVRCGIHPWMHALVMVPEHAYYALTDESGHFKIEGIPEGTYTLSVWQEALGELKAEANPQVTSLTLTYPALEFKTSAG